MKKRIVITSIAVITGAFLVTSLHADESSTWVQKLVNCSPFEHTFTHPFTGEKLNRHILGMVEDTCHVEEEMPGGAKLECHYKLERLPALVDLYANSSKYENLSVKSRTSLVEGKMVSTNTYTLDGEPYDHPIEAALQAEECVISGYWVGSHLPVFVHV